MKTIKSQEGIVLTSKRLVLRPITAQDATSMYENWASDPDVARYLTWEAHANLDVTTSIIRMWCRNYQESPHFFLWLIVIKSTNEPIGTINIFNVDAQFLSGELGYCIGRKYWNQGFTTEALSTVIDYAFNNNHFQRLYAKHLVENVASGKVMINCGMHYSKSLKRSSTRTYQSGHLIEYVITKEECEAKKNAS